MSLVWWLRCLLARSRPLTATRAIPPPARSRSDARPAANLSPETDAPTRELKSIRDIPGHGLLWTFYWHFLKGYSSKSHELQIMQKKKFGPIWRSRFGPLSVINVASVDMIESILRQEGKYPIRSYMPHWREYRELRGKTYGPLCEYGQKWHHIRSILNPKMLKPKEVATYSLVISEVVADLVKRIRWLREARGDGLMVYDISSEFYKFAFEAICKIVFETRLGCLKEEIPEETQKFIAAVFEIFTTTAIIPFFPKVLWTYVPYWKKFLDAWDYVFYITEKLVNKRMREIEANMKEGKEMSGEYLTYLLTNTNMTPKDIYGSLSEVLLAAVDTTSNTTSWIFYHLAREQSIQQQLYEEVNSVCPGDQIPVAKDFVHMPLLKAVVKETLRLYPVVPGNSRQIVEKDIVVEGYHFPKNTLFHLCHYAICQEDSIFIEPQKFLPDRWLRSQEREKKHHPFASIPFGFGTRSCLGKRLAELEMYSVTTQLIKHFEIRPDPSGKVVTSKTRTLMYPGSPINLQLIDRNVTATSAPPRRCLEA